MGDDGDAIGRQLADDAQRTSTSEADSAENVRARTRAFLDQPAISTSCCRPSLPADICRSMASDDRPGDVPLLPWPRPVRQRSPGLKKVDDGQVKAEVELLVDDGHAVQEAKTGSPQLDWSEGEPGP